MDVEGSVLCGLFEWFGFPCAFAGGVHESTPDWPTRVKSLGYRSQHPQQHDNRRDSPPELVTHFRKCQLHGHQIHRPRPRLIPTSRRSGNRIHSQSCTYRGSGSRSSPDDRINLPLVKANLNGVKYLKVSNDDGEQPVGFVISLL